MDKKLSCWKWKPIFCRCCDEKEEVTVEAPTYDYYDQAEILDGSDNDGEEEKEESSHQPELGARAQVQVRRVAGSFPSKASNAFSCPIVSLLLLLSTLASSCHFFLL